MPSCIFCSICAGKIPAEIVFENDTIIAFKDINPKAPVHVLIIPRKHVPGIEDIGAEDADLPGALVRAAQHIACTYKVSSSGYRLVINNGSDAGQAVGHLHVHFLAGRKLHWPPG